MPDTDPGKIAMVVSGLLVLATLTATFVFTLMNGEWIGLAVAMVAAVAVLGSPGCSPAGSP